MLSLNVYHKRKMDKSRHFKPVLQKLEHQLPPSPACSLLLLLTHFHIIPVLCSPPHFNILSRAPWIMELVLIKPSFRSFSCSSGLSAAPIRQKAMLSEFPNVAQHLLK